MAPVETRIMAPVEARSEARLPGFCSTSDHTQVRESPFAALGTWAVSSVVCNVE